MWWFAIVVFWGIFELRGWIADGRFAFALFVVADSVTPFCVCRGLRKTQKYSKSISCKQWSFMIWRVEYLTSVNPYT